MQGVVEQLGDLGVVLPSGGSVAGGELFVAEEVLCETHEPVGRHEHLHVAVLGRVHARGDDAGPVAAPSPGVETGELLPHEVATPAVDRPGLRLERRHVDGRSHPAARRDQMRRERSDGRDVAVLHRHDRPGELQRLPVGHPGGVHRPAHRIGDDVGAPPARVRPVGAEGGDRHPDQVRSALPERVDVDPVRRERLGAVALEHDVGPLGEPGDDVRVGEDAALVRVEVQERRRPLRMWRVDRERSGAPGPVALGRLDLHHVGAVVGEELPGERSGDAGGQLHDPDPLERLSSRVVRVVLHRRHRTVGGRTLPPCTSLPPTIPASGLPDSVTPSTARWSCRVRSAGSRRSPRRGS